MYFEGEPKATTTFVEFPQDPQDVKKAEPAIYATAYADGEPVACRVDERCLERLRACIPARKTHTAVGAPSTPLRVQARDDNVQHMLGQMIMRQMVQLEAGLPGLTIFGSGKSNIPSPSRPQQTPPMLALTDGSADIHASARNAAGGSVDTVAINPNTTEAGAEITTEKRGGRDAQENGGGICILFAAGTWKGNKTNPSL